MSRQDEYRAYLRSPQWGKLRAAALIRDGGACVFCGAPATQVHHVQYPKNLMADVVSNLQSTCDLCHAKAHGLRGETMDNIKNEMIPGISHAVKCAERDGVRYWSLMSLLDYLYPDFGGGNSIVAANAVNRVRPQDKVIVQIGQRQEVFLTRRGALKVAAMFPSDRQDPVIEYLQDCEERVQKGGVGLSDDDMEMLKSDPHGQVLMQLNQTTQMTTATWLAQRRAEQRMNAMEAEFKRDMKQQAGVLRQLGAAMESCKEDLQRIVGDPFFRTSRSFLLLNNVNPEAKQCRGRYGDAIKNSVALGGWCMEQVKRRNLPTPPKIMEGTFMVNQWPVDLLEEGARALGLLH